MHGSLAISEFSLELRLQGCYSNIKIIDVEVWFLSCPEHDLQEPLLKIRLARRSK